MKFLFTVVGRDHDGSWTGYTNQLRQQNLMASLTWISRPWKVEEPSARYHFWWPRIHFADIPRPMRWDCFPIQEKRHTGRVPGFFFVLGILAISVLFSLHSLTCFSFTSNSRATAQLLFASANSATFNLKLASYADRFCLLTVLLFIFLLNLLNILDDKFNLMSTRPALMEKEDRKGMHETSSELPDWQVINHPQLGC